MSITITSSVWSGEFLVKPLVGARPVKPWKETHADTVNIILVFPHLTPDIFDVVLRSHDPQLRTESEWEEQEVEDKKQERLQCDTPRVAPAPWEIEQL
jgi:hypothetical protein